MNAIHSRRIVQIDSRFAAAGRRPLSRPCSRMKLGLLGVLAGPSLASAACSSVSAATPPVARAATGAPACHVTSATKVLARRVFVPGGVAATEQDGAFSVRFAADPSHCVAVDWPSDTQRPQPGSCSAPTAAAAARAATANEAMLAWESRDAAEPHTAPGVVTYDAPRAFLGFGIAGDRRVLGHPFQVPAASGGGGEMAPALAPIGHDRFLLAWVEGNSESHELRAQSVLGWGDPLGPSIVLSPSEASVIGHPSVVVAPTGYGLVTYVASIEGEFDVLATPVSCAMN